MQREIAAPLGHDEAAAYGWCPDDLVLDNSLHVFQNRVPVIARFGESGVLLGAKNRYVRAIDAGESQFTQCFDDRVRVGTYIGGQRDARIAGPLTNAFDSRRRIAVEDGPVLRESNVSGGVFRRLPICVGRTALNIVDHLAIELERSAKLNQRAGVALSCNDALFGSVDGVQVAC